MEKSDLLGRVVVSKCGRDKGRAFMITGFSGEDLILISDGKIRKIGNPKKKNMKHLLFTDIYLDELGNDLRGGRSLADAHIRKAVKEVSAKLL
ncbi:MAG: KOW domain-containing RNA-binding protein [Oscillospiraceae bacterium]|nr:KOW domain-containing RNA-binding protein [Oscillospiraceae bacterium]